MPLLDFVDYFIARQIFSSEWHRDNYGTEPAMPNQGLFLMTAIYIHNESQCLGLDMAQVARDGFAQERLGTFEDSMMKPGSHLPATTIFLIYASSYQSEDRPQLPNMEVHELRNMAINVVAPTIQNIAWMSGQFVDEARNWLGSASVLGAWGEYVRGRPQGITTSDLDEVTILTLIDAVGTLVDDPARDTHELYLMNPDKSAWDHVMHVKRFLVALLVDNERGGLWQGDGPRGKIGGYFRVIIAFKVLQYVEQEVGDRRPVSDAEQAQVTAAHNQFTELMAGVLNHIVDRRRPSGTSNV